MEQTVTIDMESGLNERILLCTKTEMIVSTGRWQGQYRKYQINWTASLANNPNNYENPRSCSCGIISDTTYELCIYI